MTNETAANQKGNMTSRVTLYFTRLFVRGNLAGLTHNDTISFLDVNSAIEWIRGIKSKSTAGRLDYTLVDHSFQKYWRY